MNDFTYKSLNSTLTISSVSINVELLSDRQPTYIRSNADCKTILFYLNRSKKRKYRNLT